MIGRYAVNDSIGLEHPVELLHGLDCQGRIYFRIGIEGSYSLIGENQMMRGDLTSHFHPFCLAAAMISILSRVDTWATCSQAPVALGGEHLELP